MSVSRVWVKSRNGGERAFKVEFQNEMDFDDLIGAITQKRHGLHFPAGAVESVHSENSNEERFILSVGAKVPIPADGQIGSSADLPYFFSITRTPPAPPPAGTSPALSTAMFGDTLLQQLGLSYSTIPTLPPVAGGTSLSIARPPGGWTDEHHFHSCVFPQLSTLFVGATLINSEHHPWLEEEAEGGSQTKELKPDYFVWPLGADCLIDAADDAQQPPANDSEGSLAECVYGRPMPHCAFMVDIVVDGNVAARNSSSISSSSPIPMTDIGRLLQHLDLMCRRGRHPGSPRGLCFNDNEFVVAKYAEGTLHSVYRGRWTTPTTTTTATAGCVEAIRSYLEVDNVNGTVQGVRHFLRHYPGSNVQLALGRGRVGCVFKVSVPSSSTINEQQPFALKVVSTDAGNDYAEAEYERLLSVGNAHPHLVARAMPGRFVRTAAFCYYGIADLGNHHGGDNVATIPAARATFMKLFALHAAGVVHGDPHIANVIPLSDGSLRWIDLRYPPGNVAEDVRVLVRSVFGDGVANQVAVQERIAEYRADVSEGAMTRIYDVCRHLQ